MAQGKLATTLDGAVELDGIGKGTATKTQLAKAGEPLGSGAIESTCRQYQCRFKRTGQFWSIEGDEALMCLEAFWRNNAWHLLFPHAKLPSFANNQTLRLPSHSSSATI